MIQGKIQLGQIGYGYWGQRLYSYFSAHPGFEVTKIAVREPLKARSGLNCRMTSAQDIYDDKNIKAVIVATPVETHYGIAKDVLASGKHLFCEKVFTGTAKEAEELQRMAEQRQLKIMVDYTFTFSHGVRRMVEIAKSGQIGKLSSATFEMGQFGHFRPEGVYPLLGSHMLSILNMLYPLHEFEFVRNDLLVRAGITESGWLSFAHYRLPFGGLFNLSLNNPEKTRNIALYGTLGTVAYNMYSSPAVKLACFDRECVHQVKQDTGQELCKGGENDNLALSVDAFYEMIASSGPSNIDCAVEVARALERISLGK
ncbi:MAG: Gfo/Idh/MocA family oxidoreductase [Candidatus Saganbacteria bacterium]|nr:Gfo/Idh/MocA family oxidoreductase [Candidatus Saganbacteria bacterium]